MDSFRVNILVMIFGADNMKCPICYEVIRFKLTSKFIPTPYGVCFQKPEDQLKIETVPCEHCDGTGEIQEDTWWLCKVSRKGVGVWSETSVLKFENGNWCTLDTDFIEMFCFNPIDEIEPITRMKEVK